MRDSISNRIGANVDRLNRYRRPLSALAVLAALLAPFVISRSGIVTLSLVFIYGLLAFSAIVPIGYANQLILCQGAFFGVGAYSFVLLTNAGLPSWLSVPTATMVTVVVALLLALPALRASGIYLGIITLIFNLIFVLILVIFPELFGGDQGLVSQDLYVPETLLAVVPREVVYYYLSLVVYIVALLGFRRLLNGAVGWAFLSLGEDIAIPESIGINTRRYRMLSFAIAGAAAGLGGGIYAPINGFVSPSTFDLDTTIDIILAGVLGGITVLEGGLFGAMIVRYLPEVLGFIEDFRMVVFGLLLVLLLIYLPDGVGGYLRDHLR